MAEFNATLAQEISSGDEAVYADAHDKAEGTIGTNDDYFYVESILSLGNYNVKRSYLTFPTLGLSSVVGAIITFTPSCFPEGTLVHTAKGITAIENLRQHDLVWSFNLAEGKLEIRPIEKIRRGKRNKLLNIQTRLEVLVCTPAHPFMVLGKGWIKANNLKTSDCLANKVGEPVEIVEIEFTNKEVLVRDIIVEGNHNYFVGTGILVHNKTEADIGQADLHLVEGIHGSSLAVDDFGDLKDKIISGGMITHDAWTGGNYIMTLNAIGRGWINKSGDTKFGLRLSGDIDNETPTGINRLSIEGIDATPPVLTIQESPRKTKDVKDIITLEAIRQMEVAGSGKAYIDESGNFVYRSRFARSG